MSTEIDYRIIYKDDIVLGLLGQDTKGIVSVNSKDELSDKILKGLITPVQIDESDTIGDIVISTSRVILPSSIEWLVFVEYSMPFDFYATPIQRTSKKTFIAFNLSKIKRHN